MVDEALGTPSLFTQAKIMEDILLYNVKERELKNIENYKTNKEIERDGYLCLNMIAFATILRLNRGATIL